MDNQIINNIELTPQERIISDHIYSMVSHMIDQNIPVNILYQNNNDWDNELPLRLQKNKNFVIKIEDNTLEDSYVDEDGYFYIVADFDNQIYTKKMIHADILGILDENLKPFIMKPFIEKHPILQLSKKSKNKKFNSEIDTQGINHSMKMFKKNNPDLFE